MGQKVSIKDIAERSGVSIATVSRVINKNGRYSKETEEKVMAVISDSQYVPNQVAKELREQKTMNIGVILPDITNEFFVKLVYEIEKNLFQQGYQAFLCNTDEDETIERAKIRMMTSKNVRGLIFLPSSKKLLESDVGDLPTVLIDRIPEEIHGRCSMVSSDNVQGGYLAARELLDRGCRDILVMTSRHRVSGYIGRYEGCARAMREAGLQDRLRVAYLDRLHYQDAYDEMNRILDAGEFRCDGIFACADWLALGCSKALSEHGYAVPEQIKLVGFDDISITAFHSVPITTVHQRVDVLAKVATEQLMQAIAGEAAPKDVITVPVYLVPRESTRGAVRAEEAK